MASGGFFEYWFTKPEFENLLTQAGFAIVESVPIGGIDGIYHEFGRALVRFADWQFYPTATAEVLNRMLTRVPFCHNHMHLCVVRK